MKFLLFYNEVKSDYSQIDLFLNSQIDATRKLAAEVSTKANWIWHFLDNTTILRTYYFIPANI